MLTLICDCDPGDFDGNSVVAILRLTPEVRATLLDRHYRYERLGGETSGVDAVVFTDDAMSGIVLSNVFDVFPDDDPRDTPSDWMDFDGEVPGPDPDGLSTERERCVVRGSGVYWRFVLGDTEHRTAVLEWAELDKVRPTEPPFRVVQTNERGRWRAIAGSIQSSSMSQEEAEAQRVRLGEKHFHPEHPCACPRCGCVSGVAQEYVLRTWAAEFVEGSIVLRSSSERIETESSAGPIELWCDACDAPFVLSDSSALVWE